MMLTAASRYYQRTYGAREAAKKSVTSEEDDCVLSVSNGNVEIQLWSTRRRVIADYAEDFNLPDLLNKFWQRETGTAEILVLDENIVTGQQMLKHGCLFDSMQRKRTRVASFVKLSLPVHKYARQRHKSAELQWHTFFGQVLLFFAHKYQDKEEILCALRLCKKVEVCKTFCYIMNMFCANSSLKIERQWWRTVWSGP